MTDRLSDENVMQSTCSPGLVDDSECILRVGYAPEHIHEGEVTVSAISQSDLVVRGYSVEREAFAVEHGIRQLAERQMTNVPDARQEAFLSLLSVQEIRKKFTDDGDRAFVVLDTSLPENNAHASVFSAKKKPSRSVVKELKSLLVPLLQNRLSLDEYFSPKRR